MSGISRSARVVAAAEASARSTKIGLTLPKIRCPCWRIYPEFVEPVRELRRYEAPLLVNDRRRGPVGGAGGSSGTTPADHWMPIALRA